MGRLDSLKDPVEHRDTLGLPLGRGRWEGFMDLIKRGFLQGMDGDYRSGDMLVLSEYCDRADFIAIRFRILAVLYGEGGELIVVCYHIKSLALVALDGDDLNFLVVEDARRGTLNTD